MIFSHDPLFYAVAILAITLVGLAKGGFSGLGAASMPLLVLVMDPVRAAAMLLADIDGAGCCQRLVIPQGSFDRTVLGRMVPGAAVGIFMGWSVCAVGVDRWSRGQLARSPCCSELNGLQPIMDGAGALESHCLPGWVGSLLGSCFRLYQPCRPCRRPALSRRGHLDAE